MLSHGSLENYFGLNSVSTAMISIIRMLWALTYGEAGTEGWSREPWEQPALELVLIMLLPFTGSEHAGRFIDLRDAMVRAAKTAGFLIDYQVSTATLRRYTLSFKY